MATRQKQLFCIGCYILPGRSYKTYHITVSLVRYPNGVDPILIVYLSVYLSYMEGRDRENILRRY